MGITNLSETEIIELQYSLLEELKSKKTNGTAHPQQDADDFNIKRNSPQYRKYHKRVLKRDKVCQCCGTSRDLEVHHPLPFKKYNSLGADPNNGIVLCKNCHSEYHSKYGYKRDANPINLAQFLRDMSQQFDTKYLTPYNMDFFNESGDNGIFNRFSKSTIDKLSTRQFTILSIIFQEEEKHGKCSFELLHANKYCDFEGSIKEVPNDFEVISLQQKGLIYQSDNNSFKIV